MHTSEELAEIARLIDERESAQSVAIVENEDLRELIEEPGEIHVEGESDHVIDTLVYRLNTLTEQGLIPTSENSGLWPNEDTNLPIDDDPFIEFIGAEPKSEKESVNPGTLLIIEKVLEEFFKDEWEKVGNDYMIHFPDLTITNEKGKSRSIPDMYIKILPDFRFEGFRTTFTVNEFASSYSHSHISGFSSGNAYSYPNNTPEFANFCLGRNPILQTITLLQDNFDEDTFKMYLIQLKITLETESIIGGPYRRMQNIVSGSSPKIRRSYDWSTPQRLWFEEYLKSPNIVLSNGRVKVKDLEKEEILKGKSTVPSIICYKNPKGEYVQPVNNIVYEDRPINFYFKGNQVSIKFLDNQIIDNKQYCNPHFLNAIKDNNETRIQRELLNKYKPNETNSNSEGFNY